MNIRPYSDDDLEFVVAIFRSNIPKYFGPGEESGLRSFLADVRSEEYYVVEIDGKIIACGGLGLNEDDTVSLCWGMVHREYLGTGLGKSLTEYRLERSLEVFGPKPMVTSTSQHTEGFYHKFGFVTVERITDGFGPGLDNCKMRLDHSPAKHA